MTEQEIDAATVAVMEQEGWHPEKDDAGNTLWFSEGHLARACFVAGRKSLAAAPASAGGGAVGLDLLPQPVTFDLPHEGSEVLLYIEGRPYPYRGQRLGLDSWTYAGDWQPNDPARVTHFSYLPAAPQPRPADAAR